MEVNDSKYENLLKSILEKKNQKDSSYNHRGKFQAPNQVPGYQVPQVSPSQNSPSQNYFGSSESLNNDRERNKLIKRGPSHQRGDGVESTKQCVERLFHNHQKNMNTKVNQILQKVNQFTSEIVNLKKENAQLKSENEVLKDWVQNLNSRFDSGEHTAVGGTSPAAQKYKSLTAKSKGKQVGTNDPFRDLYEDLKHNGESTNSIESLHSNGPAKTNGTNRDKSFRPKLQRKGTAQQGSTSKAGEEISEYAKLLALAEQKIVFTLEPFECENCQETYDEEEDGVILKHCGHTFCRECLKKHILINQKSNTINCLLVHCESAIQESEVQSILNKKEYDLRLANTLLNLRDHSNIEHCQFPDCPGFVEVDNTVFDFTCEVCHHLNCIECHKIHADGSTCRKVADLSAEDRVKRYENWISLNNDPIIANTEVFECMVCYTENEPGEGVVLKNCLHRFCKLCLRQHIELEEDVEIKCPFRDDDYSCDKFIQDREIKALLKKEAYEKYLERSIKLAEAQMKNTFHCLTPDCDYFCTVEEYPNFECPSCHNLNCIDCKAIHTNLTCQQYQENLLEKSDVEKTADIQASEQTLRDLVATQKAMYCPNCGAVCVKEAGCDAIVCKCKTELCWATKGPRWGPRGTGDTSGGCKCGVGGRRCSPNCQNCH